MVYHLNVKLFYLPDDKVQRVIYITLLSIAGALIIVLLTGTIFGVVRSRDVGPLIKFGGASGPAQTAVQDEDIRIFSGLGRLRITLSNSSVLILSISFPYPAHDIAFSEELAARINDFKMMASSYFSSLPEEAIIQVDEEAAKREILRRYNNSLRLGRIETLYFSEMNIIDAGF